MISTNLLKLKSNELIPDENQPRRFFNPLVIEKRKNQLEVQGQKTPILVLPKNDQGKYVIVDGECRWRAVQISNQLDTLNAEIYSGNPNNIELLVTRLVRNVDDGSEPLTPMERAESYKRLIEAYQEEGFDNPQTKLASSLGADDSTVSRVLGLNKISEKVKDFALENGIGDTRVLNGLKNIEAKGSKNYFENILEDIQFNEACKARGEKTRSTREIVSEANKEVRSKQNKKLQRKDKQQRTLTAEKITLQKNEGQVYYLSIETPRELIRFKVDKDVVGKLAVSEKSETSFSKLEEDLA